MYHELEQRVDDCQTKNDYNGFRDFVNQEIFELREYLKTIVLKEDLVSEVDRIEKICMAIQETKSVKSECDKTKNEIFRQLENLRDDAGDLKKKLKKQDKND